MNAVRVVNQTGLELITSERAIEMLCLEQRPNPMGALRWLVRTGKLRACRPMRGVLCFDLADVQAYLRDPKRWIG